MNLKPQYFKSIKIVLTVILASLFFGSLTMGQLNSNRNYSDELNNLDKILAEIKWNEESRYLLYHSSGTLSAENENIQDLELWMVDLKCWNSDNSSEMKELFCMEEIEFDYKLENWMLENYRINFDNEIKPDTEDTYYVESWMYNLQKFQNLDKKLN